MSRRNIVLPLAALLFLCAVAPVGAEAEARSIYIGDVVTFTVEAEGMTEDTLRQRFEDFDIVELKGGPDGYRLSVRTFEAGEHTVLLGDKELVISVASTLDDIERDALFVGDMGVTAPGFSFHWRMLFYAMAGIFALCGGVLLFMGRARKAQKPEGAHKRFTRRVALLSPGDGSFLVDLTFYFKEYLESLRHRRVIGKTSAEIMEEIREVEALREALSDIESWLTACDRMKFAGVTVTDDEKARHRERLLELVQGIEAGGRGAKEGAA